MPSAPQQPLLHPIGVVARRTGLKPDLIRAWERRYGAVAPQRTASGRRAYSDADVRRLSLLRDAVSTGQRIGQIAGLVDREIERLVRDDRDARPQVRSSLGSTDHENEAQAAVAAGLEAVAKRDADALRTVLDRTSFRIGRVTLLELVVVPLMREVGARWKAGNLDPAQEHLASVVVRSFLDNEWTRRPSATAAPRITATTPIGQRHELGALVVAATAASEGWWVTYLGAELPAESIAASARQNGSRAVALSLTYAGTDIHSTMDELRSLRAALKPSVALLAGGIAATELAEVLEEAGIQYVPDLEALRAHLASLAQSSLPTR